MPRFSFSGLNVRLLLVVLTALIPSLALVLYAGTVYRQHAADEVKQEALRMTNIVNTSHEQWIERSRQIVRALASVPSVREPDPDACNPVFERLGKQYPSYTDFVAATPEGIVFCSSAPDFSPDDAIEVHDRDWFQRSVESGEFVVSDVIHSRLTAQNALAFGMPVYDDEGTLMAVVAAGLDMEVLTDFAASAELPIHSVVTILDDHGRIIARYPQQGEHQAGETIPDAPLFQAVQAQQGEGTAEVTEDDGITRLYAFANMQSGLHDRHLSLAIGIPAEVAFGTIDSILLRVLLLFGIVTLFACFAALTLGHLFLLQPISIVADGTHKLAGGNLGTRLSTVHGAREFRQLAESFNHMASTLQKHDAGLREAEARYRKLVEQIPSIIYTRTLDTGAFSYLSPRIEPLLGVTAETCQSLEHWRGCVHPDDWATLEEAIHQSQETAQPLSVEYRLMSSTNQIVWVRDEGVVVTDEVRQQQIIQGTLADITDKKEAEEIIREQSEIMRELSTPMLHIGRKIVLMPLIGSLDTRRMQHMMETLLKGVEQSGARTVILDVTGVAVVDSQVANALIQTEHAVRLLGARVVLTGIRPEVAQAMVGLGLDLGTVMTQNTLESGIAFVLRR